MKTKELKLPKTPEPLEKINREDELKDRKNRKHKVSICSGDLNKRR